MLLYNPLGFVTVRQRTGYDTVDTSASIQILFAVLCFVYAGWYLVSPRNREASRVILSSPIVFFLLYILLCLASALWSPNHAYTAFMAFQCLAFLMLVVATLWEVNSRCSSQDVIEWLMFWITWAIFWRVLLNIKSFGLSYLLYPFAAQRLSTGIFFFLGLYLCRRRSFGWTVAVFAILSLSRKNYWGIIPGLLLGMVIGDRKNKILSFAFACFVVLFTLFFGMETVIQNTLFYGKEGIGWEYTTGRDKLWEAGLDVAMSAPIIGHGFAAGERASLSQVLGNDVITAHNSFLSAFIGVGFLGPLLLIFYFISTCLLCLSTAIPAHWRFAFTATLIMVFVVGMTGPGLGGRVYGSWIASMIVMTAITIICKRTQSHPPPG